MRQQWQRPGSVQAGDKHYFQPDRTQKSHLLCRQVLIIHWSFKKKLTLMPKFWDALFLRLLCTIPDPFCTARSIKLKPKCMKFCSWCPTTRSCQINIAVQFQLNLDYWIKICQHIPFSRCTCSNSWTNGCLQVSPKMRLDLKCFKHNWWANQFPLSLTFTDWTNLL